LKSKNILFYFEKRSSPLQRWRCSCKFRSRWLQSDKFGEFLILVLHMYLHTYIPYVPTYIHTICTYIPTICTYIPTICTYVHTFHMYLHTYHMYLCTYLLYVPTYIPYVPTYIQDGRRLVLVNNTLRLFVVLYIHKD
jgi:hypothetical protein